MRARGGGEKWRAGGGGRKGKKKNGMGGGGEEEAHKWPKGENQQQNTTHQEWQRWLTRI